MIEYALKVKCVSALRQMTTRQVFDNIFVPEMGNIWAYETFKRNMRAWKRKQLADEDTLLAGTYPNFTAHHATVQVDKEGRITQAWIKQQQDVLDWVKIHELLVKGLPASDIKPVQIAGETMLEIPIFDAHFGVATLETYRDTLAEILGLVTQKNYDEINILVGQDALHNNDLRGHTAKGTAIERVDFPRAWADAWTFYRAIIEAAIKHASRVNVCYSKGNHDECASWCLFKALEAVYWQCSFDDSLAPRKCVFWRDCFIGYGHCQYTSKNAALFQDFVLDFPAEFAAAKVREIHSGHFHRESIDEGYMIRRLPSGVPTDEWNSDNGYVGAHKRFQVFEWSPGRLKAIYYV